MGNIYVSLALVIALNVIAIVLLMGYLRKWNSKKISFYLMLLVAAECVWLALFFTNSL